MPKLRNGETDIEKFTQWIGRKCRNHNPLAELKLAHRESLPRFHDKGKGQGDVKIVASSRNVLLYAAANRLFEITVREVDPEEYEEVETVAVGN